MKSAKKKGRKYAILKDRGHAGSIYSVAVVRRMRTCRVCWAAHTTIQSLENLALECAANSQRHDAGNM